MNVPEYLQPNFTNFSYIVASRECSILFAALLGTLVLKEADFRRRVTGALIITLGIGLLAIAR